MYAHMCIYRLFDPNTNKILYGIRLSVEDLLVLRTFCISIWQEVVLPAIERRLSNLTKTVSDSRKGMKNVLKSFWRKPREDINTMGAGQVRYKYDRIESQTLLLADTSFISQDYENAIQNYKLVRDDYKADKVLYLNVLNNLFVISL